MTEDKEKPRKHIADPQKFKAEMEGLLERNMRQASERTIYGNSKNDHLKPEVERIAESDACDFCKGQEGVYTVADLEENVQPEGHKNCKCHSIPHFKKDISKTKQPKMTKSEYAQVVSAINTVFYSRFEGEEFSVICIGNHKYYFRIIDFDEYEFLEREALN